MNPDTASTGISTATELEQVPSSTKTKHIDRRLASILYNMVEWLLNEPVRNTNPALQHFGSFNHGVHEKTGHCPGQYTEITGYAISLLSNLYRWRREEKYLSAAREAADFLGLIQLDSGAYPHCPNPVSSCTDGTQFTFDTSMCVTGMMDLYTISPNDKYLTSAVRAGNWLLSMQQEDGSFHARYSPDNERLNAGNFFGDGSCIHAKNALALLKLAAVTQLNELKEAALAVCNYTLTLQDEKGMFWSMPSRNFVFTHAHCYACEGLLAAGTFTGNQQYTDAALTGISWLREMQNHDGSLYQVYDDHRRFTQRLKQRVDAFKASDATAQAARLFALAGPDYAEAYDQAISFITEHMLSQDGGLYYTTGRFRTNHMMYTWPTMFAIEAIEFARRPASPRNLF